MGRNNSENFLAQQSLVRADSPQPNGNADLYQYSKPEKSPRQVKPVDAAVRARLGAPDERKSVVLNQGETFWSLAEQKYQVTGSAQNQAMQAILEANQLNAQISKRNGRTQIVAETYFAGNTYMLPAQAEIPVLAHNFRVRVPGLSQPAVVAQPPVEVKPPASTQAPVEVNPPVSTTPTQPPVEVQRPPLPTPTEVQNPPRSGAPEQPPTEVHNPSAGTPKQPPVEVQNPPVETPNPPSQSRPVSSIAYMEVTVRELERKHLQAQTAFEQSVKNKGWVGAAFDGLKNSWLSGSENSNNIASRALSYVIDHDRGSNATRSALKKEQAQLDELKRAAQDGNVEKFNQAYLALTGSAFDAKKSSSNLKGETAMMNYASSQHHGVEFLSDTAAVIAATAVTRRSPALTSNVLKLMTADAALTGVSKFGLKTITGDQAELKHDLLSGATVGVLAAPAEIVGGMASQKLVSLCGGKLGLDLVKPQSRLAADLLEQRIATSGLGWNLPGIAKWGLSSAAKFGTAGSVFGAGMPVVQESVDALTIKDHGFDLKATAQRSLTGGLLGFPLGTGFGLLAKDRGSVGGSRPTTPEASAPVEAPAAAAPEASAPVEAPAAAAPEASAPVEAPVAAAPEASTPVEYPAAAAPEASTPVEYPAAAAPEASALVEAPVAAAPEASALVESRVETVAVKAEIELERPGITRDIAPPNRNELVQQIQRTDYEIGSLESKLQQTRAKYDLSDKYAEQLEIDLRSKDSGEVSMLNREKLELLEQKLSTNPHTKDWVVKPDAADRVERVADMRNLANSMRDRMGSYEQQLAEAIQVRDHARTELAKMDVPETRPTPMNDALATSPAETTPVVSNSGNQAGLSLDQSILQDPLKRQEAVRDLYQQMLREFTPGAKLREYVKACRDNDQAAMQKARRALETLDFEKQHPEIKLDDLSEVGLAAMQNKAGTLISSGQRAGQLSAKYSREGRIFDEANGQAPALTETAVKPEETTVSVLPQPEVKSDKVSEVGHSEPAMVQDAPQISKEDSKLAVSKKQKKTAALEKQLTNVDKSEAAKPDAPVDKPAVGSAESLRQRLQENQRIVEIIKEAPNDRAAINTLWSEKLLEPGQVPPGGPKKWSRALESEIKVLQRQIKELESPATNLKDAVADTPVVTPGPKLEPKQEVPEDIPVVVVDPVEQKVSQQLDDNSVVLTEGAPVVEIPNVDLKVSLNSRYSELTEAHAADFKRMSTLSREMNKLKKELAELQEDATLPEEQKQSIAEGYFGEQIKTREVEYEALQTRKKATRLEMDRVQEQLRALEVAEVMPQNVAPAGLADNVVTPAPEGSVVPADNVVAPASEAPVVSVETAPPEPAAVADETAPPPVDAPQVVPAPAMTARDKFKVLNRYKEIFRSKNREAIKASEKDMREAGMGDLIGKQEGTIKKRWEALRTEAAREKAAADLAVTEKPLIADSTESV